MAQLSLRTDDVVACRDQQGPIPKNFEQKIRKYSRSSRRYLGPFEVDRIQDQQFKWLENTKYSRALSLAISHIVSKFEHRKSKKTEDPLPTTSNFQKAMETYHTYFPPGICTYTFPPDVSTDKSGPSPHYHFIAGESFIYLDWKLISPKGVLSCANCLRSGVAKAECYLEHDRTNFSKSRSLFPVWTASGRPTLAVAMNYSCALCHTMYLANDGRILDQLDPHMRTVHS